MSTYETMKHNIPEGATHYIDGDFYFFAWVNLSEGKYYNEGEWLNYEFSTLPDGVVKPIPAVTLEEVEVVEALEKAMEELNTTYRYEKVELSPKEVFMAMLNGEEFYVLGDLINFDGEQFWRHTEEGKSRITYINHDHEIHRRIEVTERDLFIEEGYKAICGVPRCMDVCEEHLGAMYDAGCRFVNGKG